MKPVYHIKKLNYKIRSKELLAVSDLDIYENDVIHMTGESGAGKSLFGLSLIGFFSTQSEVEYAFEIEKSNVENFEQIRKNVIGYIFQQPKAYFNPSLTCGQQLLELLKSAPVEHAKKRIFDLCVRLQLERPELLFSKYPHEYSIGQLQRIYVVSALIRSPKLIIADEPFAHLDWQNARIVADCLQEYIESNNAALLLISHEVPGSLMVPNRTWKLANGRITNETFSMAEEVNVAKVIPDAKKNNTNVLIKLSNVSKRYHRKFSLNSVTHNKWVLEGIDLEIKTGDRIGLMGASGSGKTTLAMILSGLMHASTGKLIGIHFTEFSLKSLWNREPSPVQLVFQDPFGSFNPAQPVFDQIVNHGNQKQVEELMLEFGLKADLIHQNAMSLSGGELQRMAIIRALSVSPQPRLLILDEALSALDSMTKNRIVNCLDTKFPNMAIAFISHRYERLKSTCQTVHFMHRGRFVYEVGMGHESWADAPRIALELTGQV
jgi:peptide/nickel transport system ATP-binding protein